ncbi:MAG: ribosomal protein S18-alanine N-acetyltransferase [Bacilli bacterium]|nr:ribosomal protein S18-alanine N-acetyltransferase [Bacilli bacterium]
METIIRDMRISDVAQITQYDVILLGETLGEHAIIEHLQQNALMKYLIMESKEDHGIIGQMSLWIDDNKAQINNFYILTKYQGQRYGAKFLRHVFQYLREREVEEVTLEVKPSNVVAIKLYESFGFKTVSIRKNYYKNGEDAYLMYVRIGSD